jgi:hypothetical protein
VQRAKVVRELLTGAELEAVRARTVSLLDSGQLGANEDERLLLRQQIADVLARPANDEDKVFAIGFAVHGLWDSVRFREHYADLRKQPSASPAAKSSADASKNRSDDDEDSDLEVSMSGFDSEDSGSGRPKTGSHPALKLNAGPLPIAKDRGRL